MNESIYSPTPSEIQAHATRARVDHHRYHAAYHLYHCVRPEGGLEWPDLSPDQRAHYYALVDQAIGLTDKSRAL